MGPPVSCAGDAEGAESAAPTIEDSTIEIHPARAMLFYLVLVTVLAFTLLIARTSANATKPTTARQVFCPLVFLGTAFYITYRLHLWRQLAVRYQLKGSRLVITKGSLKNPVPEETRVYDLNALWIIHTVREQETRENAERRIVTIIPKQVVLIFDTDGASGESYVLLRRATVQGRLDEQETLQRSLQPWTTLCRQIESGHLAGVGQLWAKASPYRRYGLVLMQSEVAFLQGPSTSVQMCLATLRELFDLIWGTARVSARAMGWLMLSYLPIMVVAMIFIKAIGVGSFFYDEVPPPPLSEERYMNPKPTFYLFLLVPILLNFGYAVLLLFRPLTTRVLGDEMRHGQAQRLIEAGASPADLEPVVKFIKDDLDRSSSGYNRASLIAATAAALALLFKDSFESNVVASVISVAGFIVFALVQLYYHAQMQILRQANTACLIVQNQILPTTKPG
jgi:hypothetical protein